MSQISPELRATIYSFTSFLSIGAATAYGGIWLADQGLTPDQIGIVNSAPVFALLLLTIFVGKLADKANDWRNAIIVGSWASAIFSLGLFFATGYAAILVVWALANIAFGAIASTADAANTRLTARRGTSYGAIRAWGTIGYVAAVFATGPLVTKYGGNFFVNLFVGVTILRALASLVLPRFRSEEKTAPAEGIATQLAHMMKPWLFLPLLAWAMIQSTNVALMAFQAIYMKGLGVSETMIGTLIALGAIAEAAVFYAFPWFTRNFTPKQLILIAGTTAIFRWICFAFSPGMPWLIPLQLLNAVTYGVGFIGIMNFITKWTHENMAAEAQSVLGVLQQTMVIILTTGFGYIYAAHGAKAFFASAAVAAFGVAVIIFTLAKAKPPAVAQGR